MTEIDELSRKLFASTCFTEKLKRMLQKMLQQKNHDNQTQQNQKLLPSNSLLQLNQKFTFQQADQIRISQGRYSITSLAFQKRQSRDSISSMTSNPFLQHYLLGNSPSPSINQLTTEIANSLDQMIKRECVVMSGGRMSQTPMTIINQDQNMSQLIEKMQALQQEQIATIKKSFQQKFLSIQSSIEQSVFSEIEKLKNQHKMKKNAQKSLQIKSQRRKLTQSILDLSKNNQEMSTFSNIQDLSNILSDSQNQADNSSSFKKNSPQISQLQSKLSEVERSQIKISKEFEERFLKEVSQNKEDVQTMTERIIEWKLKNEDKLESGFTGLWNIITEIEDKLNKLTLRVLEVEQSLDAN